jgi:hypothetical protein
MHRDAHPHAHRHRERGGGQKWEGRGAIKRSWAKDAVNSARLKTPHYWEQKSFVYPNIGSKRARLKNPQYWEQKSFVCPTMGSKRALSALKWGAKAHG